MLRQELQAAPQPGRQLQRQELAVLPALPVHAGGQQVPRRTVRHLRAGVTLHGGVVRVSPERPHVRRHGLPGEGAVQEGEVHRVLRDAGAAELHVRHQ